MFVEQSRSKGKNGKIYSRALLRTSERRGGKVVHRTLGNLSSCSDEEINAVRLALKHKDQLAALLAGEALSSPPPVLTQGPSVGAVHVLRELAAEIGVTAALGDDINGRLALWQVIARALDQGSRLSAARLARDLRADRLLDLPAFNENDLYSNLAWLDSHQTRIEDALFAAAHRESPPSLYLYDVTSTYLEGEHNALAAFGYNRDGKKGKRQIVVGLLCDERGVPVALEAFPGNTGDTKTVTSQISKLRERFQAGDITLVGDRGMIRGPQIQELGEAGMHYITAISKPQIEALLAGGTFSMDLFDDTLAEIITLPEGAESGGEGGGVALPAGARRYILRRNPERQREMARTRGSKREKIDKAVMEQNEYLAARPRATLEAARKRVERRISALGLNKWLGVVCDEARRRLSLRVDVEAEAEARKLDGCYALRTDLSPEHADKALIHSRYKDLGRVEENFRRCKTVELEMRPVHVRKESSTRGHLLVVMLAYRLLRELGERWADIDMTVREGLDRLNTYCAVEIAGVIEILPEPRADVRELMEKAGVTPPVKLPARGSGPAKAATKSKLPKHRPKRRK